MDLPGTSEPGYDMVRVQVDQKPFLHTLKCADSYQSMQKFFGPHLTFGPVYLISPLDRTKF